MREHQDERAKGRPARGLVERRRGAPVACMTAYLDPELARAVRVRAALEGRTASDLVGAALAALLEREPARAAG